MHLSEKTLDVKEIFNGKIINVTVETVELENGETAIREMVHHSGGVCVVPLTDDNEVIFVEQFRYPYKKVLLEIPAGKLEKGEDPRTCGIRELKEEAGAEARDVIYLGNLYPTVAYDTEIIYMYLAKGLTFGKQDLDEGEFLDVKRIPLETAFKMAINNEIPDSKTQIAIFKTYAYMNNMIDKEEFARKVVD